MQIMLRRQLIVFLNNDFGENCKCDVVIDELTLLFDGVQDQDMIIDDKTSSISNNQVKQSLNKIDEARQRFQKLCRQNGIFVKLFS